jgi:Flp pilus assembly protein TadD
VQEAIGVFKNVLSNGSLGPDQTSRSSDLLHLLASAEAQAGQTEGALDHLRQAVKLSPKEERGYFELAAFCIQRDNLQTAADVIRAGLQNTPDAGRLRALQGVIDAQSGRYDEAAAQFEMANALDPKSELGAAGLGALYLERNQPDSAAAALRHRLQANPNDPTLTYFLAEALMQQPSGIGSSGADDEARQALLNSLRSKPDFAKAHALLGKLYIRKGDDKKAIDELRLAEKYDPSNRLALSQLAIALRHLGRSEEAAAASSKLRAIVLAESNAEADLSRMRSVQLGAR